MADNDESAEANGPADTDQEAPSRPPPGGAGGLASGLQPGGTLPGGGPGTGAGSIGTGGGATGGVDTGDVRKGTQ
jgi:hypothetical protein